MPLQRLLHKIFPLIIFHFLPDYAASDDSPQSYKKNFRPPKNLAQLGL